jgi:hypothetical protein
MVPNFGVTNFRSFIPPPKWGPLNLGPLHHSKSGFPIAPSRAGVQFLGFQFRDDLFRSPSGSFIAPNGEPLFWGPSIPQIRVPHCLKSGSNSWFPNFGITNFWVPNFWVPNFWVPNFRVPNFRVPNFRVPNFWVLHRPTWGTLILGSPIAPNRSPLFGVQFLDAAR